MHKPLLMLTVLTGFTVQAADTRNTQAATVSAELVAWHPTSPTTLISPNDERAIRVWNTQTGMPVPFLLIRDRDIESTTFALQNEETALPVRRPFDFALILIRRKALERAGPRGE